MILKLSLNTQMIWMIFAKILKNTIQIKNCKVLHYYITLLYCITLKYYIIVFDDLMADMIVIKNLTQ